MHNCRLYLVLLNYYLKMSNFLSPVTSVILLQTSSKYLYLHPLACRLLSEVICGTGFFFCGADVYANNERRWLASREKYDTFNLAYCVLQFVIDNICLLIICPSLNIRPKITMNHVWRRTYCFVRILHQYPLVPCLSWCSTHLFCVVSRVARAQ